MTPPAPPASFLPRSILSCLPILWGQVLFPGTAPAAGRVRWASLLILTVLPAVLLYPSLGFLLFEPDEGRYAEIPREMLVRGEWVVPYLQGQPYLDKPPLLYWLVIGSYRLFGVHDWAARLVPALALHGCIFLTYWFGRRSLGERPAFWGALALSLAPGFITVGRFLVLDGVLAFWATLSLFAAFEAVRGDRLRIGWWLLAAAACGLGVLTKGPVAVLLLVPPIMMHRWLTGSACRITLWAWAALAGIVLGISLPWYAGVWLRLPEFGGHFFLKHNVVRFLSPFDHQHPVWFYLPILLGGFLPATLLGWCLIRFLTSGNDPDRGVRSPALGFMLLAGGWCVLFFSLAGSKLPTYILPAFPPLALAVGVYFAGSRWLVSRWTKPALAFSVLVLLAAHHAAIPWYAHFHSPMSRPEVVREYCGDPQTPVVCYPRNCDSVAFYLGRDDLRNFRSKETNALVAFLRERPRTVVLFTHRHSANSLTFWLPAGMRLTDLTPVSRSWSNYFRTESNYMGVVEKFAPP